MACTTQASKQKLGTLLLRILSQAPSPADACSRRSAVLLMSQQVARAEAFVARTGTTEAPLPAPISRMWIPGAASCPNSAVRYRLGRKKRPVACCW